MPSVPIEMPSETPAVKKRRPTMSASFTPSFTASANMPRCMLHGLPSYHMAAIPTWGSPMSSTVRPAAWSIAWEAPCTLSSVIRALTSLSFRAIPPPWASPARLGSLSSAPRSSEEGEDATQRVEGPDPQRCRDRSRLVGFRRDRTRRADAREHPRGRNPQRRTFRRVRAHGSPRTLRGPRPAAAALLRRHPRPHRLLPGRQHPGHADDAPAGLRLREGCAPHDPTLERGRPRCADREARTSPRLHCTHRPRRADRRGAYLARHRARRGTAPWSVASTGPGRGPPSS